MLQDLSKAAVGKRRQIRTPQPINGIAPCQAMNFKTPLDMQISDLSPVSRRSTTSRRTLAHNIAGGSISYPSSRRSSTVRSRTSTNRSDVDELIAMVDSGLVVEEKDETSSMIEDIVAPHIPDEIEVDTKPAPSRRVRRRVTDA
jgi:hypothetical protein